MKLHLNVISLESNNLIWSSAAAFLIHPQPVPGHFCKIFQAVGVALPPTIRDL
jgi:hypothetical protein